MNQLQGMAKSSLMLVQSTHFILVKYGCHVVKYFYVTEFVFNITI